MTTEWPEPGPVLQRGDSAEDRHNREVVLHAVTAGSGPWSTQEFVQEVMSTSGLTERRVYLGIVSLISEGVLQFSGSMSCPVRGTIFVAHPV